MPIGALLAVVLVAPSLSFAGPIVSCRGKPGLVEFLDAKDRTVKSFTNKEYREVKGDKLIYDLVNAFGCLKGKFAYVIHQWGKCPLDDGDCTEAHSTLEIYNHTGRRTWKGDITIDDAQDVAVARNDERALFTQRAPPFGIVAVDPQGVKTHIAVKGALFYTAISPNGRFGTASSGKFAFFDVVTGKIHEYKGPGIPWVNDAGKFEVWLGSTRKNDWSLGPDGEKMYEFKFE